MVKTFTFLKIMFLLVIVIGCGEKEPTMHDLLKKTAKEHFFIHDNIYLASARVAYFDSISAVVPDNQKDRYILKKAEALLYAGTTKDAIKILEPLLEKSKKD